MIDFSLTLPYKNFLGKVLRLPFSLIPKGVIVSILSGPLRKRKWIVGAGVHGCWLGTYELHKQQFLLKHLKRGITVYDVGAHAGFYTLLAAHVIGTEGKVYAFEPSSENLAYLQKHVELNALTNVAIFGLALSDFTGRSSFDTTRGSYEGRLVSDGETFVEVNTIDELLKSHKIEPAEVVKIDVEGAEFSVLRGGASFFQRNKPMILLSIHTPENRKACCSLLKEWGFHVESIDQRKKIDETNEIAALPL